MKRISYLKPLRLLARKRIGYLKPLRLMATHRRKGEDRGEI